MNQSAKARAITTNSDSSPIHEIARHVTTGKRAFDNVRKAVRVVLEELRSGGPEEQAFAEHLRTHLSIGFECLYTQPQGRIWS